MTDVPGDRELFVGNIPGTIHADFLIDFLNGAMRFGKLCDWRDTPIVSCQINKEGGFGFVELTSPELANKCLNLTGILFLNARLKVGRPKKYNGPHAVHKTWQEVVGDELSIDVAMDSDQEKVNRELFVGNTSPEMTEQLLKDFLGSAMCQVGCK
jgi:RNA recognition motif-containing protein